VRGDEVQQARIVGQGEQWLDLVDRADAARAEDGLFG
jgi:hypothetical protein